MSLEEGLHVYLVRLTDGPVLGKRASLGLGECARVGLREDFHAPDAKKKGLPGWETRRSSRCASRILPHLPICMH